MTGERPGTSDLGQNYRNYSRTIFVPGLMRIHDIQHQFQDPGHMVRILELESDSLETRKKYL